MQTKHLTQHQTARGPWRKLSFETGLGGQFLSAIAVPYLCNHPPNLTGRWI